MPRLYIMLVRLLLGRSEWDRRKGKKRGGNEITRGKHSLLARNIIRRAGNRERADESGREVSDWEARKCGMCKSQTADTNFPPNSLQFPCDSPGVPGFGSWLMEQRTYHELQEGAAVRSPHCLTCWGSNNTS